MNPQIDLTRERLRIDMQDPEGYRIYLRHVKARKDMATALATGGERGKQEGRQEGRWEEKIAMILRLAQMGLGIG